MSDYDDRDHLTPALASLKTVSDALLVAMLVQRIRDLGQHVRDFDDECKDFVLIAATSCNMPIAGIHVVDDTNQYIVVLRGDIDLPIVTPRPDTFCNVTLQQPEVMVIPDTLLDDRVNQTSWVIDHGIRFYAGSPLVTDAGYRIGTIWVIDQKPGALDDEQTATLAAMSRLVMKRVAAMMVDPGEP